VSRDWHAWYRDYEDPTSSLSARLRVVKKELGSVLAGAQGPVRLLSLCSGDGRDTLPVIDAAAVEVSAVLVELDPLFSAMARESAAALDLDVEVRTTDAGTTDAAVGAVPADVVMACGIFGNVTDADVVTTVATLPSLLAPGGAVVWTRRHRAPDDPAPGPGEPAAYVRDQFLREGFEEVAYVEPDGFEFRVGVHRWPGPAREFAPGVRMFDFV
jgi:catechol 2,3-dioxygenase-like lactoylglutathione lyase family enzyme